MPCFLTVGRTGVWHTLTGSNEDVTIVRNQYISWKNYRLSGERRFRCVVRSADGSELARYQTLVSLQGERSSPHIMVDFTENYPDNQGCEKFSELVLTVGTGSNRIRITAELIIS